MSRGIFKDLTGTNFKTFVVLSRAKNSFDKCGTSRARWNIMCLICRKEKTVKARYISRGGVNCESCKKLSIYEKEVRIKELYKGGTSD